MTGFAQGRFSLDRLSIGITIKSLNHRFLDISFKGSGTSQEIEKMVKEIIKTDLHRGKVEIAIDLFNLDQNNWDIQFNEYLLSNILDRILHFKKKYKSELSLSLDSLLKIPMIFHLEQTGGELSDKERSIIEKKIKKLFQEFIKSREEEGREIAKSIASSLEILEENIKIVQKKTAVIEAELFSKYTDRMKKYLSEIEIDDKRILQEAAILAEKSCVTEEVNRLKTHATRVRNIMKKRKNDLLGKELDFLTQELLREISTISAKTNSMDVNENIILIRREIEKIKQQVQNVE